MNFFTLGRLAGFGKGLYTVIGMFLRILLIVVIAGVTAVIVNLRHSLLDAELKVGLGIVLLILGSTVMHIIYAVGISIVHRWIFPLSDTERTIKRSVCYMFCALVPAIFLNLLLLQILVFSDFGTIFGSSYWLDDFPFFFVPLLAYVLAVLYWPAARLSIRKEKVVMEGRGVSNLLGSWIAHGRTFFLLSYLNELYGNTVLYSRGQVRMLDIVFIYYDIGHYYFILRNGTKIKTLLNSKSIEKWKLAGWFLPTSRWTYINMLYVQMPNVGDKHLKLASSVEDEIRKSEEYARINLSLSVNRKMKPKLDVFVLNRKSLLVDGWDEMIAI